MKHDDRYAILAYNAWHSYLRYMVNHYGKLTEEQQRVHRILVQTIPLDIRRYSRWKAWQYWIKQMLPPMVALALSIVAVLRTLLR